MDNATAAVMDLLCLLRCYEFSLLVSTHHKLVPFGSLHGYNFFDNGKMRLLGLHTWYELRANADVVELVKCTNYGKNLLDVHPVIAETSWSSMTDDQLGAAVEKLIDQAPLDIEYMVMDGSKSVRAAFDEVSQLIACKVKERRRWWRCCP